MLSLNFSNLTGRELVLLIILTVWSIIWKGFALWKASKNNHLVIFIIFLVLNTIGIAEIIYLLYLYIKDKKQIPAVSANAPTAQ